MQRRISGLPQLQTEMDVTQKEGIISLQEEALKRQNIIQIFTLLFTALMVFFSLLPLSGFCEAKKSTANFWKSRIEKKNFC